MFSRIKKIFKEYKELKYLAYHDSLTGLLNRNWLFKNYDKINTKYIYFIDINNLRKINEKGHTQGDKHIQKIVNLIFIDYSEIFVRYAGDEFILFTNDKNKLKTNELFSVGFSENSESVLSSINFADLDMINQKFNWKQKNNI